MSTSLLLEHDRRFVCPSGRPCASGPSPGGGGRGSPPRGLARHPPEPVGGRRGAPCRGERTASAHPTEPHARFVSPPCGSVGCARGGDESSVRKDAVSMVKKSHAQIP